jgi:hypothetical protein
MPLAAFEVALAFAAFYAFFAWLCRKLTAETFLSRWRIDRGVAMDIACKTVSAAFASSAAASGIFLMCTGSERRPTAHPLVKHIMLVTMAYFLYDTVAMFKVFAATTSSSVLTFVSKQPLIVLHHVLLAVLFTPLMMTRLDHEPGDLMIACALVFETSTPFVSLRAVLAHLGLKKSLAYTANGLCMMLVFFCCRILVYPFFYWTYGRQRGLTAWEAVAATPPFCAVYMAMVLAPQLYWFRVMVNGARKLVAENNNSEEEEAKEKTQ